MEPQFLDDETLTDNLGDTQASRVINWLITVFQKAPQNLEDSVFLARELNLMKDLDPCIFDQKMSQLEKIYE